MNFFKKLFSTKKTTAKNETQIPGVKPTFGVTKTSYHVRPKQISRKKVYADDDLFSIRGNVIQYRKEKKVTQKDLSNCLNLASTSFISRLERGESQSIKHEEVEKVANCLGVSIEKLLLGNERID